MIFMLPRNFVKLKKGKDKVSDQIIKILEEPKSNTDIQNRNKIKEVLFDIVSLCIAISEVKEEFKLY